MHDERAIHGDLVIPMNMDAKNKKYERERERDCHNFIDDFASGPYPQMVPDI